MDSKWCDFDISLLLAQYLLIDFVSFGRGLWCCLFLKTLKTTFSHEDVNLLPGRLSGVFACSSTVFS